MAQAFLAGRDRELTTKLTIVLIASSMSTAWADSVTLAWNPSTSANVAGYNIYYADASRIYSNEFCAGPATTATISGLAPGTTYYFTATAYTSSGLESDPSYRVTYTVPDSSTGVQTPVTPTGPSASSVTGPNGQTFGDQG